MHQTSWSPARALQLEERNRHTQAALLGFFYLRVLPRHFGPNTLAAHPAKRAAVMAAVAAYLPNPNDPVAAR